MPPPNGSFADLLLFRVCLPQNLARQMILLGKHYFIVFIVGARLTTSTAQLDSIVNSLMHKDPVKASSSSDHGIVSLQSGADVGSFKEHEKDVYADLGVLGKSRNADLGEGVLGESHRDLVVTCREPSYCILCTMGDGSAGKKCDGLWACRNIDTSKVSCGSCNNGDQACEGTSGQIAESSCNGYYACYGHKCELVCYTSFKF